MLKPIYLKGNTITTYKIFCSKVKSKEDFFKRFCTGMHTNVRKNILKLVIR